MSKPSSNVLGKYLKTSYLLPGVAYIAFVLASSFTTFSRSFAADLRICLPELLMTLHLESKLSIIALFTVGALMILSNAFLFVALGPSLRIIILIRLLKCSEARSSGILPPF